MKLLLFIIEHISNLGWKWIISLVFPVYWRQDCEFQNNGYDIICIVDNTDNYIRGTFWKVRKTHVR